MEQKFIELSKFRNQINRRSMNWSKFKDPVSHTLTCVLPVM